MANTVQLKRSSTPGSVPTTLAAGEVAVNNADGKIFVLGGSSVVDVIQQAASTTTPAMDGRASYGSASTWARADHIHPNDTTRLAVAAAPHLPNATPPSSEAVTTDYPSSVTNQSYAEAYSPSAQRFAASRYL